MYGSTESADQFESEFTESTSSNDRPFCPTPPPPYEERRVFNIGSWEFDLLWINLLFAFVVVVGDVGQDISLHLYWLSSSKESTKRCQVIDSYFVLSFGSLSSFVIFGLGALFIRIVFPRHLGENEKSFPQFSLSLIGLCSALNEALAVFAIGTTRTPLYLQIILGTLTIPLTVLFRRLILRKKPTCRKLLCAGVVTIVPVVFGLIPLISYPTLKADFDQTSKEDTQSKVLWPLVFAISFVPAAIMNVLEEKAVKKQNEMSRRGINLFYFFCWISFYQLVCTGLMFWVNIIPWFGNACSIQDFGEKWRCGAKCFFGAAGCDATPGIEGTLFIFMNVLSFVGGANLLRHAEGATWLAIIMSLSIPVRFIVWSLFSEVSRKWQVKKPDHWLSAELGIAALVFMFSAAVIYFKGAQEITLVDAERTER